MLNEIILYLFLTCGAIQLVVYAWLYPKATSHKNTNSSDKKPPVSVVICAHNEEKNLKRCLSSVLNQKYPDFEVVIVNDRSTDRTAEIISAFQNEYNQLKVVTIVQTPENFSPKKHALTEGIKSTSHEWLLFTDADCYTRSDYWIQSMFENLKTDTNVILGVSPFEEKENSYLNRFQVFENQTTALQYLSLANVGFPYMAVGRNLAYQKSLFINANGFEDISYFLGGDDDLFINKISKLIHNEARFVEDSQVFTCAKDTLKTYIHQKKRHLSVSVKYRFWHKTLLGTINSSSLGMYVFAFLSIVFYGNTVLVLSVIALKISLLFITYLKFQRTLCLPTKSIFQLAMMDMIYILVLHVVGIYSFLFNPKKWHYGPENYIKNNS